jgi:peptidyl-prolyl cis-trans isomerase D
MDQLKNGADFAALAKKYSDDPGSASKGGDLGRIEPGDMVKPFQDALFSLDKEGALVGPVKTRFGYHIIELTKYEPGHTKPLSEVRDQVEKQLRSTKAERLFSDRAETFRNVSYEQPDSLEPVADKLGLKIQQSDWFTRKQGTGIAADPKVREAAFSSDVSDQGLNSAAIELDVNSLVVVRKLDVQPASVKPLNEVRDEIEAKLKHRKAEEHVASLGPELVKQLDAGSGWDAVLDKQGLKSEESTRSRAEKPDDENGPDPAVTQAVFRAPRPGQNKPVYGGLSLSNGNYALFRLVEVIDVKADQAGQDLEDKVHEGLARRQGQDMMEEYVADLRDQAKVKIKDSAL